MINYCKINEKTLEITILCWTSCGGFWQVIRMLDDTKLSFQGFYDDIAEKTCNLQQPINTFFFPEKSATSSSHFQINLEKTQKIIF